MLFIIVLWVLVSILVAYLGRRRVGGFWGTLLFSIIFSPLVALLALVLMREPHPHRWEDPPTQTAAS